MTGGATYKISWADQQAAAGFIKSGSAAMQSHLDDINKQINQLLPTWDATSQGVYHGRQDSWNKAAQNIHTALTQFQGAVDAAAGISQGAESSATKTAGG